MKCERTKVFVALVFFFTLAQLGSYAQEQGQGQGQGQSQGRAQGKQHHRHRHRHHGVVFGHGQGGQGQGHGAPDGGHMVLERHHKPKQSQKQQNKNIPIRILKSENVPKLDAEPEPAREPETTVTVPPTPTPTQPPFVIPANVTPTDSVTSGGLDLDVINKSDNLGYSNSSENSSTTEVKNKIDEAIIKPVLVSPISPNLDSPNPNLNPNPNLKNETVETSSVNSMVQLSPLTSPPPSTLPSPSSSSSSSSSLSPTVSSDIRCLVEPKKPEMGSDSESENEIQNRTDRESTMWERNKVLSGMPNYDCNAPWFITSKAQLVKGALKNGDIQTAHYYFAKIDEAPNARELLKSIIKDNYTLALFNDTLKFIHGIFSPHNITSSASSASSSSSLKLEGYRVLLESLIANDGFSTTSRQELFRLAHVLKAEAKAGNFNFEEFKNVTDAFSQGIKSVVFDPFFRIKNIHDSYVFHYKPAQPSPPPAPGHGPGPGSGPGPGLNSNFSAGENWAFTGKCKNCNESELIAEPDDGFHFFTIRNPHLKNGLNCLGVKNRKGIFWVEEDVEELERESGANNFEFAINENPAISRAGKFKMLCEKERWQIKFVGKTLANIIYYPQVQQFSNGNGEASGSGSGGELLGQGSMSMSMSMSTPTPRSSLSADTEALRGFGLTRSGFNKKVSLESTLYLNSNQIWLTT